MEREKRTGSSLGARPKSGGTQSLYVRWRGRGSRRRALGSGADPDWVTECFQGVVGFVSQGGCFEGRKPAGSEFRSGGACGAENAEQTPAGDGHGPGQQEVGGKAGLESVHEGGEEAVGVHIKNSLKILSRECTRMDPH